MKWHNSFLGKNGAVFSPSSPKFQAAELKEDIRELHNPARGWYQVYSFEAQKEINSEELQWYLEEQDTLVLVIIDIGIYRNTNIDREGLENICEIIEFFINAEKDIILRIVYDNEGNGMENEPDSFPMVLEHMRQLGSIIQKYASSILVLQGLFIGSWGEMHHSQFLTEEKLYRLAAVWQEATRESCFLSVCRPVYWRLVTPEMEGRYPGKYLGKIGLFDDAMFASDTHLGTFGKEEEQETAWRKPWSVQDELVFEEWLGNYIPFGGEVVCPKNLQQDQTANNPEQIINKMRQMHVTYLNQDYDKKLLEYWDNIPCPKGEVWQQQSCYKYIGSHLGYRFIVRQVKMIPSSKKEKKQQDVEDQTVRLEIQIENSGFANLYQEAEVWLVAKREGEEEVLHIAVPCDARKWKSGSISVIEAVMLRENIVGCSKVYLEMNRKWDEKRIYFANSGREDGRVLLGKFIGA